MVAIVERRDELLRQLEEALEERVIAEERFEAAIGTGEEMHAYLRLRQATRRLSAADAAVRRAEAHEAEAHKAEAHKAEAGRV